MEKPKPHRHFLAISFYFPPFQGSGSIRNLKLINEILDYQWACQLLTVKERYFRNKEGMELIRQIDDQIKILRTTYFNFQDVIVAAKYLFRPKKKSQHEEGCHDGGGPAEIQSRSKFQILKDFITDFATIPDQENGWFGFGLLAAIVQFRRQKADLIYAVGQPWTAFFIGYCLKLIYKIPLVIDFMDPWTQNPLFHSKGNLIDRINLMLERFIVEKADHVIANTQELADDFIRRLKLPESKVSVITCGYDEKDFPETDIRMDGTDKGKLVITHTGSFTMGRSPLNFLKAVRRLVVEEKLPADRLKINFIGDIGVYETELPELLSDLTARDILHMRGWVPHSKAIEYMYQSDLLLLVQPSTKLQIPAKLYEYIYTRKPILAIAEENGAIGNLIRKEEWGACVDHQSVEKITERIHALYLAFMEGKLETQTRVESIEPYSVKQLANRLAGIFDSLAD